MGFDENKLLERFAGLKFSNVKNCNVCDKTGEKIGRLLDAIFKPGVHGLHLTKFTIGGSWLEELLEDIGLKKDIDPVFPVDLIESMSPKRVKLNVEKSALKSTEMHADAILEDEIKLSGLSKMKLYDNNNEHIGNIQDVKFYKDGFKFIVGDGVFRELLEDLGWVADIDFLVAPEFIEKIERNKVVLSKSQTELKATFDRHIDKSRELAKKIEIQKGRQAYNVYYPVKL